MDGTLLDERQTGRTAWTASDLEGSGEHVLYLPDPVLREVDIAVQEARKRGLGVQDFGKPDWSADDLPLEAFVPVRDKIRAELEDGLGFLVIKGLEAQGYSADELATIFWALGCHIGRPVTQSVKGDYLGHVRDEGGEIVEGHYRGFKSAEASPYHSDNCDVAALLCVRPAKSGGHSGVVSAAAIHNDMLENRPDLLEVLYEPFYMDWRGEEPDGWKPYYQCPVFSFYGGKLSIRGGDSTIFSAQEKYPDVPRLTEAQVSALQELERAAKRHELTLLLEAGDIFIFNNYAVLHSRTAYEDYGDPDDRRHLMRLWLEVPNNRELAEDFSERYRPLIPGVPRGGYGAHRVELA